MLRTDAREAIKLFTRRARLRLVACVAVHKAAKDAAYVLTDANIPYGNNFIASRAVYWHNAIKGNKKRYNIALMEIILSSPGLCIGAMQ